MADNRYHLRCLGSLLVEELQDAESKFYESDYGRSKIRQEYILGLACHSSLQKTGPALAHFVLSGKSLSPRYPRKTLALFECPARLLLCALDARSAIKAGTICLRVCDLLSRGEFNRGFSGVEGFFDE